MKKLIVVLVVIASIVAVIYYNWNRKNQSLQNMSPAFTTTSGQLFSSFEQDESVANKNYLNKVVEVKGKVREIRKESTGEMVITLDGSDMFGVICRMDPEVAIEDTSMVGKEVSVKGLCTGMLMDVVMVRCVFTK